MLSRSFTKAELQLNQLKHKQLPPQLILHSYKMALINLYIIQLNTNKSYLIKNITLTQFADYDTDQFSIRINDKGNYIVVKPLHSFPFKSVTPFQTKFKTPNKKNNKTLHQQSLLLIDTDNTSDDEDHIYARIPKHDSSFSTDTTIHENYSTLKNHHLTLHKKVLLQ